MASSSITPRNTVRKKTRLSLMTADREGSRNGVYLLRIWLFIIRHSIMQGNKGCGIEITGWDGFVTDNQLSGNGSHGFACNSVGATVMFTANRVEWNRGYGIYLCAGDAWIVTGNCFDRNGGARSAPLKCAPPPSPATSSGAAEKIAANCRKANVPARSGSRNAAG